MGASRAEEMPILIPVRVSFYGLAERFLGSIGGAMPSEATILAVPSGEFG